MLVDVVLWLIAVFCLVAGIYCLVVYKDKVPVAAKIVFWLIMLILTFGLALWFSVLIHSQFYPLGVNVTAPIVIYDVHL